MTEEEYVREKVGLDNNITRQQLSELIKEYNEIQVHIKSNHVKLSDKPILVSQWIGYNERYNSWLKTYEGRLDSMDAGMSRPNKPNYFRANND